MWNCVATQEIMMAWQLLYICNIHDIHEIHSPVYVHIYYTLMYISSSIKLFLQVTLPVAITPRYGHSAVVFGSGASFRVVVLFGGYYYPPGYLSKTTLLLLGECTISATYLSTQVSCCIPHSPSTILLLIHCPVFLR